MNTENYIDGKIKKMSVSDLDFYGNLNDRLYLKEVFKTAFKEGDDLFFSFRREENLTELEELVELRKMVPREFERNGEYIFIRKIDEERFDSIGRLKFSNTTPTFLLDVWKYFYAFTIFTPCNNITWHDYIHYVRKFGLDDIDGERMLKRGLSDFIFIKGLGGDYFNINYLNNLNFNLLPLNNE